MILPPAMPGMEAVPVQIPPAPPTARPWEDVPYIPHDERPTVRPPKGPQPMWIPPHPYEAEAA